MLAFLAYEALDKALHTQSVQNIVKDAQAAGQFTDDFRRNVLDLVIRRSMPLKHLTWLLGPQGQVAGYAWDMDMRPDQDSIPRLRSHQPQRPHQAETPLAFAIGLRKIDQVTCMLSMGAPIATAPGTRHPLHALLYHIADKSKVPVKLLDLLQSHGMSFNDNNPPVIHSTLIRGNARLFPLMDWVKELRDRGMVMSATDPVTGDTTTHLMVRVLNERKWQVNPIMAAFLNDPELAKDVFAVNKEGHTPRSLANHESVQHTLLTTERSERAHEQPLGTPSSWRLRKRP